MSTCVDDLLIAGDPVWFRPFVQGLRGQFNFRSFKQLGEDGSRVYCGATLRSGKESGYELSVSEYLSGQDQTDSRDS